MRHTRFGVALADFDNDGRLDLYEANGKISLSGPAEGDGYAEPNTLYRGSIDDDGGIRFDELGPTGGVSPELVHTSRAVAAGVTMVNGTDYPPGDPIEGTSVAVYEMGLMQGAGLHPRLALAGATSNAARLLGMESEIGTVEEGKVADLVAVEENPVSDVAAMRDISFVMQSGRVVRDDRPAA